MDLNNGLIKLLIYALPVIFAITLHEAAHGYVAKRFGDSTAYMMGRVTLNPIKHIDPIGTLLVPGVLMLLGSPFVFGWAKPVPVNFRNLRSPKRDSLWVAFAGPFANLVQVLIWALVLKVLVTSGADGRHGGALLGVDCQRRNLDQHHVRAAEPAADPAARWRAYRGEPAARQIVLFLLTQRAPTASSSCWRSSRYPARSTSCSGRLSPLQ